MSRKQIVILCVLGLAAIGALLYGFGVFHGATPPKMLMRMEPIVNRKTGRRIMQPTFGFSAPVRITSLRVYDAKAYAEQGEKAVPVWALVGKPISVPLRGFHYGQFIRKMKLEKKGHRPVQLIRDHRYCLVMKTDRGVLKMSFTYGPQRQPPR